MLIVVVGASFLSYFTYQNNFENPKEARNRPIIGLSLAFYSLLSLGSQPVLRKIGLDFGATPLQGAFIRYTTGFLLYITYILISHTVVNTWGNTWGNTNYILGRNYVVASVAWALGPILSIYWLSEFSPFIFVLSPFFGFGTDP